MLSKKELELFYKRIGDNIKEVRIKNLISQEELAKHLGFKSRISIANIESAKQNVQVHTLFEIATFLGIQVSQLFPSTNNTEISKQFLRDINKNLERTEISSEKVIDFVKMVTAKK